MNRLAISLSRQVRSTRAIASRVAVFTPKQQMISAPMYMPTRMFGAAAEPFLDPKVVTDRIMEVIKNFEKVDASKLSATSKFKEDLDLDSLDAVEIVMAIEEEFCIEIPDAEADKILSIPDAITYIAGHPMAK